MPSLTCILDMLTPRSTNVMLTTASLSNVISDFSTFSLLYLHTLLLIPSLNELVILRLAVWRACSVFQLWKERRWQNYIFNIRLLFVYFTSLASSPLWELLFKQPIFQNTDGALIAVFLSRSEHTHSHSHPRPIKRAAPCPALCPAPRPAPQTGWRSCPLLAAQGWCSRLWSTDPCHASAPHHLNDLCPTRRERRSGRGEEEEETEEERERRRGRGENKSPQPASLEAHTKWNDK